MKIPSKPLMIWQSGFMWGIVFSLLCPVTSWAVDVGGTVNLADKAKNQPSLRIQISANVRPQTSTGGFDIAQWKAGTWIPWTFLDGTPPPYTEADPGGSFNLPITPEPKNAGQASNGSSSKNVSGGGNSQTNGSTGQLEFGDFDKSLGLRASVGYRLSAGYEGYYSNVDLDPSHLYIDKNVLKFGLYNYISHIDWWKQGFDAQGAGQKFEQETGQKVLGWEKYFGDGQQKPWLSTAWAPANGVRNEFNWGLGKDHWLGSENNAVTNTAPAQGLYPHTWAGDDDASPMAYLYLSEKYHD